MMMRERGIRFFENLLCAGSSVLIVAYAHLHPEYWFVSLLALIPFLWRVIAVGRVPNPRLGGDEKPDNPQLSKPWGGRPARAVILGMMLATCYAWVAYSSQLWTAPSTFLLKLLVLNIIFTFYGLAISLLKRHIGFNAIFIAALWLPLEYVLSHHAGFGSLFALSADESGLLVRIGSLFGMLMISFVVVVVNTVILIFLRHVVQALLSGSPLIFKDERKICLGFKEILFERSSYYFPTPRAPPRLSHCHA